tara:strand:- start:42545 stop:42676 length:132 start_codon:yes stop_codon:yes gene_type:complete
MDVSKNVIWLQDMRHGKPDNPLDSTADVPSATKPISDTPPLPL